MGTVCKTALITGQGQGTSFRRYTLPVFPGHTHCTWEYFRAPIKSQPEEMAALREPPPHLKATDQTSNLHTYLHCVSFDCSLIRKCRSKSCAKRSYAQTTILFLFYSFSIPLCQSDPAPRGTKNSIVGVTQQGKAAALDSG